MEFNITNIIAGLSIIVTFLGVSKIDNIMKKADIEEKIRGQVNFILVVIGTIVTLLSGYILFFVR